MVPCKNVTEFKPSIKKNSIGILLSYINISINLSSQKTLINNHTVFIMLLIEQNKCFLPEEWKLHVWHVFVSSAILMSGESLY